MKDYHILGIMTFILLVLASLLLYIWGMDQILEIRDYCSLEYYTTIQNVYKVLAIICGALGVLCFVWTIKSLQNRLK